MRPERFRYEMNKAFDHYFETGSVTKFKPLMREMKRVWKKWSKRDEDYRSGFETYGYNNAEEVKLHMAYISDRWYCAFRLKWIIDGIEGDVFS